MLNLFQHLTKSWTYETLKQVQGDRLGLFTSPSYMGSLLFCYLLGAFPVLDRLHPVRFFHEYIMS